jgi:hypothetical protein
VLTNELEAGDRLVVALHNDVLQQIAEARFNRSVVAAVDFQVIRNRALLAYVAVGLTSTIRAASPKSARLSAISCSDERPCLDTRQFVLAGFEHRQTGSRGPFVPRPAPSRVMNAAA